MNNDTLPNLMLTFFDDAPDEELTVENMCAKWGSTEQHLGRVAMRLHGRGLLSRYKERLADRSWQYVYTRAAQKGAA